jgi:hypothetical protein
MATSWTDEAKQVLGMAAAAIQGVEVIAQLSRSATAESAANVLAVIATIANTIRNGFNGTATVADVEEAMRLMIGDIAANDAAAQSDVDSKFPK